MKRGSWIYDKSTGELVEREEFYARQPAPKRSGLAAPLIMGDSMAPVQSMLDGKMYDSKSALRATYKAAGVVEVGNDPARLRPRQRPKVDRKAIKDTLDRAAARFNRGERAA
jgi:hypothetical protein